MREVGFSCDGGEELFAERRKGGGRNRKGEEGRPRQKNRRREGRPGKERTEQEEDKTGREESQIRQNGTRIRTRTDLDLGRRGGTSKEGPETGQGQAEQARRNPGLDRERRKQVGAVPKEDRKRVGKRVGRGRNRPETGPKQSKRNREGGRWEGLEIRKEREKRNPRNPRESLR